MSDQKNTLTVTILDREYRVACPAGQEEKLTETAQTLNRKMREIRDHGKVFGIERIAVMAALNLTHELIQAKPSSQGERVAIARLNDKISQVLPDSDHEYLELDLGDDHEF